MSIVEQIKYNVYCRYIVGIKMDKDGREPPLSLSPSLPSPFLSISCQNQGLSNH